MARKKQKGPYNIPDSVLTNLSEHTRHGYLLFTYDDQENFRVYIDADNDVASTSLKVNAGKWLQVMDNIEASMMAQSILGATQKNSPPSTGNE